MGFEVDVLEAADGRFELRASGPIEIEARYAATPHRDRTELEASVAVRGRGVVGRLLSGATDAILGAGALDAAVARLAAEAQAA